MKKPDEKKNNETEPSQEVEPKKLKIIIEESDLRRDKISPVRRVLYGLLGLLTGVLGSTFVMLGGFNVYDVWVVYFDAFAMAFYGYFWVEIRKRALVGRSYEFVFYLAKAFQVIVVLTIGIVFVTAYPLYFTTDYFSRPVFLILGESYIILGLSFQWLFLLDPFKEGGLSLLQYLEGEDRGSDSFGWVKRGLRKAEKQLKNLGMSFQKGILALGAIHAILGGTDIDEQLRVIGVWLRKPRDEPRPLWAIETLLFLARQAEQKGAKPPRIFGDYSPTNFQNIVALTIAALAILAAVLKYFFHISVG
jgi:hypothetical protein